MQELQNWSESLEISISDIGDGTKNGDDEFETLFEKASFPCVNDEYIVDDLVLLKSSHSSGGYKNDRIDWIGRKPIFQSLALVVLASAFYQKKVCINITHAKSEVKKLIIDADFEFRLSEISGAFTTLQKFEYWPEQAFRERFDEFDNKYAYPSFMLSNESDLCVNDEERKNRDVVYGFGRLEGLVYMSQFLLDISRPSSLHGEYNFESEGLFRRIAPMSHMARFCVEGCELFKVYEDWFK